MSEQENLDISRVIGVIMENPQLIEQISALIKPKNDSSPEQNTTLESEEFTDSDKPIEQTKTVSASATYSPLPKERGNRAQLLGALKPYVSKERAKAIDSVISIADILDMMRAR